MTKIRDWSGFSKNQHFQLDISVPKAANVQAIRADCTGTMCSIPSTFMELNAQMLYGKEEIRGDSQHDDVYYLESMRDGHPLDSSEFIGGFGNEGMATFRRSFMKPLPMHSTQASPASSTGTIC